MSDEQLVELRVDVDRCIGVGQCELLEPDVFELDDDEGISTVVGERRLPRGRADIVIDRCPSGAISIVDR